MPLPPVHRWPEALLTLVRTFGLRGGTLRAIHELRRALGWFRPAPRHQAQRPPVPSAWRVDEVRLAAATDRAAAVARADRVVGGEYQAFANEWRSLPADPRAWHRHPGTGGEFPQRAWWTVPHLSQALGDIKQVWEPARFAWVYDLVRAWLLTHDPRYPEAFHRIFRGWLEAAPPFTGAHWGCGQETTIRAIALLHAEANLPATEAEADRLTQVLGWSGERIADAIGYAISQRNNHSISEATGLIAIGQRLSGSHPEAGEWIRRGRAVIEREIREQFAPDGWYIQHSFNYLRVALDQCVAAESALQAVGSGLSEGARERLRAALRLIIPLVGPDGGLPNHGPNDGALVLPRSLASFEDYRPTLTQAAAHLGTPLPADLAPDAEALAWLGASAPVQGAAREDGVVRGEGWAVARKGRTVVFLRAGTYRSRPGHLDLLHLDVRTAAGPVIVDPGTYLYNAPPPWNNGLAAARVHNGPLLDGREPGLRGPRFLWYLWPRGGLERTDWSGGVATLVGRTSTGLRREVRLDAEGVMVRDQVGAGLGDELQVCWTLHPGTALERIQVEGVVAGGHGVEGEVRGWYSPRYGERRSTRYIDARRPAADGAEIITRIQIDP